MSLSSSLNFCEPLLLKLLLSCLLFSAPLISSPLLPSPPLSSFLLSSPLSDSLYLSSLLFSSTLTSRSPSIKASNEAAVTALAFFLLLANSFLLLLSSFATPPLESIPLSSFPTSSKCYIV